MDERPSVLVATRAVSGRTDIAVRVKACRALMREAVRRCAELSVGCTVEGVEEVEFADRAEKALDEYLTARSNPDARRPYVGSTSGMDEIVNSLSRTLISETPPAGSTDQANGGSRPEEKAAA